jgi:pimeloyl-ACP methyl ester carboxylesterase
MADFSVDQVTSLFPAAEVQTIEDAGHWVHAEARDRFLTRVTEFLHNKVEPEGGA